MKFGRGDLARRGGLPPATRAAWMMVRRALGAKMRGAMSNESVVVTRRTRWFYLTAGALIAMAFVAAIVLRAPLPPKTVVMTPGTPGSAYEAFAQQYQRILARSHVELRLMPSAGAVENLQRLNDPRSGVSVGFARGGLTDEKQSPELTSLGT